MQLQTKSRWVINKKKLTQPRDDNRSMIRSIITDKQCGKRALEVTNISLLSKITRRKIFLIIELIELSQIALLMFRNDFSRMIIRRESRRFGLTRGRSYEAYDIQRRLASNARCTPHPHVPRDTRIESVTSLRRGVRTAYPSPGCRKYVHIRGGWAGKADAR